MPRANRYVQPGCLYHVTHRCHNREFLFRFGVTREEYRKRLRKSLQSFHLSLLGYCITSNHTHQLLEARKPEDLAAMMQKLEGEFAQWYNRRKKRSGAFWTDRYHLTMVEGGEYAWNCLCYIDMNMVRARAVEHPSEWRWCGYDELAGSRQRYRLTDRQAVLKWLGVADWESFQSLYRVEIEQALLREELSRNPIWTESLAVGSAAFTESILDRLKDRRKIEREEIADGVWTVRETETPYSCFSVV